MAALGDRHRERIACRLHRREKPVRGLAAADLAHPFAEDRVVFDPVPVGVDDRMADPGTDFGGALMGAHAFLLARFYLRDPLTI